MGLKEEYHDKVKAQVQQWDAKIEELKAKAQEAKADSNIAYLEQLEKLKTQRDNVAKNLEELITSGEDSWQTKKEKMDIFLEKIKGSIEGLMSELKK